MKDSGKRVWKGRELDGAFWKEGWWEQWRMTCKICVHTKVDTDALERFMEPEHEEVSLRYILKYSAKGCSNVFLFLTPQRKRTTLWQAEDDGW